MKRTLAIALISLLVVSSTALALESDVLEWTEMVKDRYGGMTINAAVTRHPAIDAMIEMTKEFTELTGINVKFDIIEEGYLRNKLLIEAQGKTGIYDILLIDAFSLAEYVPAHVALELEPLLNDSILTPEWYDYEDIVPAYRDGIGKLDGKIYGVPIAGETRFVGYRKDLFEKYGKEPPKNMDELLELAKFFNGKEDGLYGIAMRAQKGIHFASGFLTTMYQLGGHLVDQKTWEVLVDDPATIEALRYHIELLKQGPSDTPVYTHEEALSAFSLGRTAMWFDATALSPWTLDPEMSLVYDKIGFVPPPEGPAGAYGVLAGWDLGISPDVSPERQEAAWAFIVWMTGKPNVQKYVRLGGTPVRESVFMDPVMIEENWTFPIQLESLERAANLVNDGILWLAPHPDFIRVLEVVGNYGSQVLIGQLELEEAVEQMQVEAEAIMGK